MANSKTIRRNIDKATTQAFYTKAIHDHGADVVILSLLERILKLEYVNL